MTLQETLKSPYNSEGVAVVLYHANCCDGFGAAWAFGLSREKAYNKVYYIPVSYGDNPFLLNCSYVDRDIYILDFSFPRDVLIELSNLATKVVLIDHHKTAAAELLNWEPPQNVHIFFDMAHSGAMLTWLVLAPPGQNPPELLKYIEDRDLWRHQLECSAEINAVVANTEKIQEVYTELNNSIELRFDSVVTIGIRLLASHQRICNEISKDSRPCSIQTDSGTYHGLACNCTPQFASDVGHILANNSSTFGATYYTTAEGNVKWSLRSNGDYDVSAIAQAYGGGGHKNAAGFTLEQNGGSGENLPISLWKLSTGSEGYEP